VPEHRQPPLRQPQPLDVRRGLRADDLDRLAARELDGPGEALVARGHVGPHVGGQGEPAVVRGDVHRADVAATSLDDLDLLVHRQLGAAPGAVQDHRAVRVPPRSSAVADVAEAVGKHVQAGTRPDLEQPDRQRVTADRPQQTSQERRRPSDLVGLRSLVEQRAHVIRPAGKEVQDGVDTVGRPGAADRRVVRREPVGRARQHQPVQAAREPERQARRPRVVLVPA
jgi:hypothetical protein